MAVELIIVEGPQAGRRLPVQDAPVTVGRSESTAVPFPEDKFLSGTHASVQADPRGVLLTDLRSTNGTYLNGQRISQAVAAPGDIIKIGSLSLQVAIVQPVVSTPVLSSPLPPAFMEAPPLPGASATTVIPKFSLPPMEVPLPPSFAPQSSAPAASLTTPDSQFLVPASAAPQPPLPDVGFLQPPPVPPPTPAQPPQPKEAGITALQVLQEVPAPLFALVNAAADEMVPVMLGMADLDLWEHCLAPGDRSLPPPHWAPYLLPLAPDSRLLRLFAEKGWGKNWAAFFTSAASFEDLKQHIRRFLQVQLDQRGEIYFRFYEPRVIRDFLPAARPEEVAMFFGPVQEWLVEGDTPAALLRIRKSPEGGAVTDIQPVSMGGLGRTLRTG